jgi:hypothetical protein
MIKINFEDIFEPVEVSEDLSFTTSNDTRAYLYHRMFQTNRKHLDEFFSSIGVDWYVRLLRNQDIEKDEDGNAFFKPRPEPFDYKRANHDLYRYYMFKLKKQTN